MGDLRWGPLDFHPLLSYAFDYYTIGGSSALGQRSSTVLQTVTAGLTLNLGTHWVLNYAATLSFFTGSELQDSTSQTISLQGTTTYRGWPLGLAASYITADTVLIETGTQTSEVGDTVALNASHPIGGSWSINVGASDSTQNAIGFSDISMWTGSASLNYEVNVRLNSGLTLSGGYDFVTPGTDMAFESAQGYITYQPGTKTTLSLSGGAEQQQFSTSSIPSALTPIFSASLSYLAGPKTSVMLSAARTVNPSFFGSLDETSTMLTAAIQRTIVKKLSGNLSAGYGQSTYAAIVPGKLPAYFLGNPTTVPLVQVRTDTTSFYGFGVQYAIRSRLSAYLNCLWTQNGSSQGNFGFTSQQVMVGLNYQY